jgi:hypothetical protein
MRRVGRRCGGSGARALRSLKVASAALLTLCGPRRATVRRSCGPRVRRRLLPDGGYLPRLARRRACQVPGATRRAPRPRRGAQRRTARDLQTGPARRGPRRTSSTSCAQAHSRARPRAAQPPGLIAAHIPPSADIPRAEDSRLRSNQLPRLAALTLCTGGKYTRKSVSCHASRSSRYADHLTPR